MNKFVFFHNPDEVNGYLSNWYKSNFTEGSITFTSMEQYMMYKKAMLFGDTEVASKILKTSDVAKIKTLGREARGFNSEVWDVNKIEIVTTGLKHKFLQNPVLAQKLMGTGDAILAECAVKDTVWGIGLSMKDPKRFDMSQWRGQNLLGQCLMTVRQQL